MAHNIYKDSMFSVKEAPWHGIGKVVTQCPTSAEAIEFAGMDYEVCKGNAWVQYEKRHRVDSKKGIMLDNTFFTYRADTLAPLCRNGQAITSEYQIIQNKEAFNFFDSIVGDNKAIYETAGVLGIGEQIFITAKLSNMFNIGKGDDLETYLLLTMRHDGLGSITSMITPVRVVCNNTLNAALNSKAARFTIRHTSSARAKLDEAAKLYKFTLDTMSNITEIYQMMTRVKITNDTKLNYINSVFLTPKELVDLAREGTNQVDRVSSDIINTRKMNVIMKVLEYSEVGAGQQLETAKGTMYGAYNAITGYFQNVKEFTSNSITDNEKKFKSNLLTNNYSIMQTALINAYDICKGN